MRQQRPDRHLGGPHDEFWAWCDKGQLRLQRCRDCGELSWPVVPVCGNCAGRTLVWERMSGRGTIVSWCTFDKDYYDGLLPMPWETIVVELEEGPYFIGNPVDFTAEQIEWGMPVTLAFLPCMDSYGQFQLPAFERQAGAQAAPQARNFGRRPG